MSEQPTRAERDVVARLVQLAGPPTTLDAARRQRLEDVVRPVWQRTLRQRRARQATVKVLAAAAVVLALVVGSTILVRLDPLALRSVASVAGVSGPLELDGERLTESGAAIRSGQRLGTGEARVALELRDGVAVRLDRQSQLRVLAGRELALERGAVYVDTVGGSGRGLRVLTPFGAVEDIGTRFEVRVDRDHLRVRVRDGLIIVRRADESWDGRPGEELTLGEDAAAQRASVPGWGEPWEWTLEVSAAGDFDGKPLADFLAWAARESGTDIRFESPELGRSAAGTTVHGDVTGLPLHEALDTVLPVCGLAHEFTGGELVLSSLAEGAAR